MQDLSHTQIPPGGWQFYQPQTKWSVPNPISQTFNQAVQLIIRHRLSNKAVTLKHNLAVDVGSVSLELDSYTRARLKMPPSISPKPMPRQLSMSQAAGAVAEVKRAAQGTRVVLDWLTSGGAPVEKELAEKRASICVNCPKNIEGKWYTVGPAELIRETLSARSDLKLETQYDNNLKSCDVCKCLMRLKVWTPLHFILERTKTEVLAEFPDWCWIKKQDQ